MFRPLGRGEVVFIAARCRVPDYGMSPVATRCVALTARYWHGCTDLVVAAVVLVVRALVVQEALHAAALKLCAGAVYET